MSHERIWKRTSPRGVSRQNARRMITRLEKEYRFLLDQFDKRNSLRPEEMRSLATAITTVSYLFQLHNNA